MTDRNSFAHLHVHTEFSMLDGASRVDEVVAAAAADGQPALGITDHGNMYGVLPFYAACRAAGITPVIGFEAYMAHDHRAERINTRGKIDDTGGEGEGGKKAWYHLTLLAENNTGYRNLIQLASRAFLEGYYRKPKVDWEILADHSEGVIATSGCLGGHVLQSLLAGDFEAAMAKAGRLQEIFGRDNFFIELQDHGIAEQQKTNPQLVDIATRIGAPLLATNDSHYTRPEDAEAHDALLCVQTNALISQSGDERFKFKGSGHYLRSAQEMRYLFRELTDACDNTLVIAERAGVEIEFGKPQLPNFPLPPGFTSDSGYLHHLTFEGAKQRWGRQLPDDVVERLDYELRVIDDMGFSSYFLIVWDLIRHARESGIRVGPGRGSAAGCAVAYCLRITDLDPIKYDLLFERFLNPSRISMPDIDMDFDSRYRDEMIRYAAERYGRDRVAQIVTFSTIKARAAVRDAARVLGYPYIVGDKVAKAMPPLIMGRDTPLKACLELTPGYEDGYKMAADLRAMYETDADLKRVMDVAKGLEGLRRQDGIHAAAVVITKEPLTEYLPIQRKPDPGQDPDDAPVVTQYEMHGVEDLGLLKMDFLGLRNLDVLTDAVELIRHTRGIDVDIDAIPLDDEPTFELLRRADSIGVFQLEGGPMRALMRSLAPTTFEDVAALVALYRPGPMAANMHNDYADRKNGRKPIEYFHGDAEEILADTYGLMIYQESVMRVAQKFAGYSLADADNLRKACFPAGSRMRTPSGDIAIERVLELADRRVETVDVASGASLFEAVDDVWSVGMKAVYRLTTGAGFTVEATANHPFLVDGRWQQLGHVAGGDRIAVVPPDDPGRTHRHGGPRRDRSVSTVERHALVWDTVVSIEYVGERECFDFRMANPERPYAVVEDFLAHNCGKKVRALMAKERDKFVDGVATTGYDRQLGVRLFDIIEQFADYAFNKSHSYGYGFVAYQTAYLKANYPEEYFSALLTSVKTNLDKAAVYLADCRAMGIEVTVPDVNRSASDFTPVRAGGDATHAQIVFGLSAVRNVGEGLVALVIEEREKNGPFLDFYDFCERVDLNVLNKRTIESLIKAGGFDSVGHPRKGLLLAFEAIIDQVVARRRERDMGVLSLFGEVEVGLEFDERPKIADVEFDKSQRLAFEKEMLGLYVSDHPLLGAEGVLRRRTDGSVADLAECEEGAVKIFGGIVTGLQRKWTKRGELMAVFTLEDLQSSCEVMVFPKTMTEHGHKLDDDLVVCVKGRVDKRDEAPKLIAMEIDVFEGIVDGAPPLRLKLPVNRVSETLIDDLKALLAEHEGDSQVFLHLGDRQVLRLPDQFCVDVNGGLLGHLRVLLGPDAVLP